jgi:hypothetical protein
MANLLTFLVTSACLVLIILIVIYVINIPTNDYEKHSSYECGFGSFSNARKCNKLIRMLRPVGDIADEIYCFWTYLRFSGERIVWHNLIPLTSMHGLANKAKLKCMKFANGHHLSLWPFGQIFDELFSMLTEVIVRINVWLTWLSTLATPIIKVIFIWIMMVIKVIIVWTVVIIKFIVTFISDAMLDLFISYVDLLYDDINPWKYIFVLIPEIVILLGLIILLIQHVLSPLVKLPIIKYQTIMSFCMVLALVVLTLQIVSLRTIVSDEGWYIKNIVEGTHWSFTIYSQLLKFVICFIGLVICVKSEMDQSFVAFSVHNLVLVTYLTLSCAFYVASSYDFSVLLLATAGSFITIFMLIKSADITMFIKSADTLLTWYITVFAILWFKCVGYNYLMITYLILSSLFY